MSLKKSHSFKRRKRPKGEITKQNCCGQRNKNIWSTQTILQFSLTVASHHSVLLLAMIHSTVHTGGMTHLRASHTVSSSIVRGHRWRSVHNRLWACWRRWHLRRLRGVPTCEWISRIKRSWCRCGGTRSSSGKRSLEVRCKLIEWVGHLDPTSTKFSP